jgi:hypothetical protein
LLSEVEDDTNKDEITSSTATRARTSTQGRPLKRTQPYNPESPPRKKSVSTKPGATTSLNSNTDQLLRIEALLKRVEERAEWAEKRVESLEKFIRNELFPRIAGPVSAPAPASRSASPPSPPPSLVRGPLPGIGLDLSRVQDREIKEGNAGVVRQRANEALKERGITCLGVNSKGKGRYRLLFKEADVDGLRRDDSWVRTHFDKGVPYGEQWYPIRIDKAYREVATDELGCTIFGRMNGVKVHKMRWLGTASVDKEYRTMVVYLDRKEEVDRLLAKITVEMANGRAPNESIRPKY